MNLKQALKELESCGDERTRAMNTRNGAPENQYGAKKGDIRKVAKAIKTDHDLALQLWETGNVDAQFLATLIIQPASLSTKEMDAMVRKATFQHVADWFNSYVAKKHPEKEKLRLKWMKAKDPMAARAGWSLTWERTEKDPDGLDAAALLDRIEAEMADADPLPQWTMNFTLAGIGIHFPKHRKRAIAIGEKLGVFRDYPCPKGCTSPFAPIWIEEMVRRKKA